MKTKVFLLVVFLVAGSNLLFSQYSNRRLSFGVTAQPAICWIHADESTLTTGPVRLGFDGGFRIDYKFEKFYALSIGASFNQTGGTLVYKNALYLDLIHGLDTLQPGTKVTYRLQYVDIPLSIKFLLPEIGYATWFAEIGLNPMFNTKALINATDNNIENEPFQQGIGKFNLAWHAGIGTNYSLGGRVSLQFALVYKNTFLDVTRENNIRKADNSRINQVGLRIGLVI